jgi:hypothetical protein
MAGLWKNSPYLSWWGRRYADCGWDDFSTDVTARQPTGKWVGDAEYSADHYVCNPGQHCRRRRLFATFCHVVYAARHGFAAVKFDVDLNGRMFYPCPRGI